MTMARHIESASDRLSGSKPGSHIFSPSQSASPHRDGMILSNEPSDSFSSHIDTSSDDKYLRQTVRTTEKKKSRIAFGSCNEQDSENKMWPIIASRNPAAFIWGGDAIYADIEVYKDWSTFPPVSYHECATPERLRALYRRQLSVPGYRQLLQQNVTVFGTYDDHDYGCDNADKTYEHKYESGLAYVNFLGMPYESAMSRRVLAGHGVYGVKLFDFARPEGHVEVLEQEAGIDPHASFDDMLPFVPSYSNQTVAVFVLDIRANKTPWKKGSAALQLDYDGDFLGERQWQWFENAIRRSRATVNVVVNGLQVHANRHPDGNIAEAWGRYPKAQQRLYDLLLEDGVQSPILISGDVHMAQLMRKDCVHKDNDRSRSLVELTTSGMTHSWGTTHSRPLFGETGSATLLERHEAFVKTGMVNMLHRACPWTDVMKSNGKQSADGLYENGGGEGAKQGLQFSLLKNFGELEFDWDKRTVALRAFGEVQGAPPLLMANMSMDSLSGGVLSGSRLSSKDFEREAAFRHPAAEGDWICINHRGRDSQLHHMIGRAATMGFLTILVPFPVLLPSLALFLMFRRRRYSKQSSIAKPFP